MANQKRGSGVAPKQSLMTGAVQRFQENLAHPARREWWHMRYPNAMDDPFTNIPKIKRELAAIDSLQARGQRFIDTADGGTYHKILNDRLYTMEHQQHDPQRVMARNAYSSTRPSPYPALAQPTPRRSDRMVLDLPKNSSNSFDAGDWVDKHLLGGAIENWGNVQGLYDSGRATLTQRNLAAARGTAEVVGLATSAVGAGAGIRLVARNYGEKQLLKALAKESNQQLISRISGKSGSFNRFWGTAGDDAVQAIGDVRRAKFYHLPRGADRRALLTYREIIRRNIGKRLSQNMLHGKTLSFNDPGLRRTELINLALKKTQYR